MTLFRSTLLRLRALLRPGTVDRDLNEEIRQHLEFETEKNIRAGMSAEAARRKALLDFGGVERTKEAHDDGWGVRWIQEIASDLRYAARHLQHSPGLAAAAILTLALGIGANTAIVSVLNALILRSLPIQDPGTLVEISGRTNDGIFDMGMLPLPLVGELATTDRSATCAGTRLVAVPRRLRPVEPRCRPPLWGLPAGVSKPSALSLFSGGRSARTMRR